MTVWLVRIWTHKNFNKTDKKLHTISQRSENVKNGQKRTKNGYCVNPSKMSICITQRIRAVAFNLVVFRQYYSVATK